MKKMFLGMIGITALAACSSLPLVKSEPSLTSAEIKKILPKPSYQCSVGLPFTFKEWNLESLEKMRDFIKNGSKFPCDWRRLEMGKKYEVSKFAFKCNAEDFKENEKKEYGLYYGNKNLIEVEKKNNIISFLDQLSKKGGNNDVNFCTDDESKKIRQEALLKDMFGENTTQEYKDFMLLYRHAKDNTISYVEANKKIGVFNELAWNFLKELKQASQEENPVNKQIKIENTTKKWQEKIRKKEGEIGLGLNSVKGIPAVVKDIRSDTENGTVKIDLKMDLYVAADEPKVLDGDYGERTFSVSLTEANKKQIASLSKGQKINVNGIFYHRTLEPSSQKQECSEYLFPFCFRIENLDFSAESPEELAKRKAAEAKKEKQRVAALEKTLTAKKCSFLKDEFDLKMSTLKKQRIKELFKSDENIMVAQTMENFFGLLNVNVKRVGVDAISCFTSGNTTGYTIDGEGFYFKKFGKKLVLQGTLKNGEQYPCGIAGNRSCDAVAEDMIFSSDPAFAILKGFLGG